MNRRRLGRLERRKGRPLEALAELAAAAGEAPADLRPRLLGAAGLAVSRAGLLEDGAELLRRALDLAADAGNDPAGRRTLRHLDAVERLRPPFLSPAPSSTECEAASKAAGRLRRALELPDLPATTRAELEDLDELRYRHPERALCRLLPVADRLPPELAVRWLAVTGSTYRLRAGQRKEIEADLRRAHAFLQSALWAARRARDVAGEADALQRLGYVLSDRGGHRQALELAERAGGIYDRIGDKAGRGRALVDQGVFLYHLGAFQDSAAATLEALGPLPHRAQRSRFAAFQLLGSCYNQLGNLTAAGDYVDRAGKLLDAIEPRTAATLLWLRAAITARRGGAGAVGLYRQALEILRGVHYADAALITVELVRALILQGRLDEALQTALTVRELVIPLQRNRHVSAALAELIRGGREALTLARVERVRAALEQARTRPDWRTYKVR